MNQRQLAESVSQAFQTQGPNIVGIDKETALGMSENMTKDVIITE